MIFDMPSCGGCRTCEMACSFKHTGEFRPEISSIRILEKEDIPGYVVLLIEEQEGLRIACDVCKELESPLCLQYCEKSEDLKKILRNFLNRVRSR